MAMGHPPPLMALEPEPLPSMAYYNVLYCIILCYTILQYHGATLSNGQWAILPPLMAMGHPPPLMAMGPEPLPSMTYYNTLYYIILYYIILYYIIVYRI